MFSLLMSMYKYRLCGYLSFSNYDLEEEQFLNSINTNRNSHPQGPIYDFFFFYLKNQFYVLNMFIICLQRQIKSPIATSYPSGPQIKLTNITVQPLPLLSSNRIFLSRPLPSQFYLSLIWILIFLFFLSYFFYFH